MDAPELSETIPEIFPYTFWARTAAGMSAQSAATRRITDLRIFIKLPPENFKERRLGGLSRTLERLYMCKLGRLSRTEFVKKPRHREKRFIKKHSTLDWALVPLLP